MLLSVWHTDKGLGDR